MNATYQERQRKGGGWECQLPGDDALVWRKLLPCRFTSQNAATVHAGTKTQTRRLINPQPDSRFGGEGIPFTMGWDAEESQHWRSDISPRWPVGTVLWIQSPWRTAICNDSIRPTELHSHSLIHFEGAGDGSAFGKLRPAMFLPLRFARPARYLVTAVRVERVNEISEADALAEGCDGNCHVGYIPAHQAGPCAHHFAQLWDSIHKKAGTRWTENPWVFVYEFQKITP